MRTRAGCPAARGGTRAPQRPAARCRTASAWSMALICCWMMGRMFSGGFCASSVDEALARQRQLLALDGGGGTVEQCLGRLRRQRQRLLDQIARPARQAGCRPAKPAPRPVPAVHQRSGLLPSSIGMLVGAASGASWAALLPARCRSGPAAASRSDHRDCGQPTRQCCHHRLGRAVRRRSSAAATSSSC